MKDSWAAAVLWNGKNQVHVGSAAILEGQAGTTFAKNHGLHHSWARVRGLFTGPQTRAGAYRAPRHRWGKWLAIAWWMDGSADRSGHKTGCFAIQPLTVHAAARRNKQAQFTATR
jgi:hypothetical protein